MSQNGKKRGRPRALTAEKQDDVICLISIGGSRKMAAKFVGVSVTTIADEAKRNEEFSDRLCKAEAKCYLLHLKTITDSKNWRAASWFLARKYPEEFAQVKKHAQTDSSGVDLTPQQRHQLIDAIIAERKKLQQTE